LDSPVRIDADLKKEAQASAKQLGLPLSAVVSGFLRSFVATGEITFRAEPRLRPDVEAELLALHDQATAGQREEFSPQFDQAADAIAWLKRAVDGPA
jgi:antitoxin component of RelBE/YafQ-DinJ toxin-antitoxin module